MVCGTTCTTNNYKGIQFVSPIEDFPEETYEKIIAINMSSAFYTTKYTLPHMKQQGWGRIVNIASAHAKVASPFKSACACVALRLLWICTCVCVFE